MLVTDDLPGIARIVIVGAGMTGCSLAFLLSQLGLESVVLDARGVSGGASGRNGGILVPDTPFEAQTAARLRDFIVSHHVACDFTPGGFVQLFDESEPVVDDPEHSTRVSPEKVLHAAPNGFGAAFLHPDGATFWPAKVVRALARAAAPSAQFVEECRVEEIGAEVGGRVVLRTSKGLISSERVIVATNGWIPRLLPELAPHFRACINTVILTKTPLPPEGRWAVPTMAWGDGAAEVYGNMRPDGRLLLGGLRSDASEVWAGDDDSQQGEPRVVAALRSWAAEKFPVTAEVEWEAWTGVLGFPTDGEPILGEVPGRGGKVFVCGGFCGHGMPRCFGLATALAQRLAGRTVSDAEVAERWDVARFLKRAAPSRL